MAVLTALLPTAGCYAYTPVVERGRVAPATAVALRVTDAGRVELAGRFGEGVRAIEGTLRAVPDSTYRLSVTAVQYIDGRVQSWAGESVVVPTSAIGVLETRSVSKGRTWLLVGGVVAGIAGFILSRSLGVFGGVGTSTPGSGGGQQQS